MGGGRIKHKEDDRSRTTTANNHDERARRGRNDASSEGKQGVRVHTGPHLRSSFWLPVLDGFEGSVYTES